MKNRCKAVGCKIQCFNDNEEDGERDWFASRVAANAYFDLSQEEKDRADRDLYGTEEPIDETPEFVANKMEELDRELSSMNDQTKKYYTKALQVEQRILQAGGEEYVGSANFRLMFLRADLFDARLAARRLTIHFKDKYDLFGEERLARRIKYLDLTEDEKVALVSGALTYTGAADRSGRPIIVFRGAKCCYLPTTDMKRLSFYVIHTIVEESEEAQKKGLVAFGYNIGRVPKDPLVMRRAFQAFHMAVNGLPLRYSGFHNFYDDEHEHFIMNLALVVMPNSVRTRFIAHYITRPGEFLYKSLRYGINPNDLPITEDGDFKYDLIRHYWERQREAEI